MRGFRRRRCSSPTTARATARPSGPRPPAQPCSRFAAWARGRRSRRPSGRRRRAGCSSATPTCAATCARCSPATRTSTSRSSAGESGGGFGLAKGIARRFIRLLSGFEAVEPLSGQRALSSRARAAVFPLAPGFGCETRMTIDAARAGLRVEEVELDLEHRATGRDARGFLHRGRQLVDLALGCGPLAVNFRGRRLPLVGWLVGVRADPAVAAIAAIGLADDLWSGEERGFRAHLAAGRTTGVLKLVGIPLVGLLATRKLSGAILVGLAANTLNQLDTRPGRALKAYLAGRHTDGSTARDRRPAADLRSSRDGHARGRGVQCAWVDARLAFRESTHGTRPVDRDRRPCRPHRLRRASFPR